MIPSISIPHDRDHHRQEGDHDRCVNGRRNQQDRKAGHFTNPAAISSLWHDPGSGETDRGEQYATRSPRSLPIAEEAVLR